MYSPTEDISSFLDRNQRKELLRFLTCGSVDDGKSTLIGRLLHDAQMIYEDQLAAVKRDSARVGTTGGEIDLALLTDGLKAEREQGITIDVAYRYFSTDKRKFIIADTPGHEQYTRNMATGASTCQLAIILIDARHGLMPQTRRHSFIVSLLGIKHIVVAINKMDLVDYAQSAYEKIRDDYTDFVARLGIPDVRFIPMSALRGDNVVDKSTAMPWYDGQPLLSHLETVHIASDRNLTDLRFPVQYVLRPNLDFRGFAGTVASGVVRKGDELLVLSSGKTSRVKSIVTFDGELEEAFAPQAITLTLEDEIDISRGDMLVRPASKPHLSSQIDAMVVWMAEKPFVTGKNYWIKQTTRTVSGEMSELRYSVDVNTLDQRPAEKLEMNEVGCVQLTLNQPLAFDAYKSNSATGAFIIIDRLTNNTVGAGMILEPGDHRTTGDLWHQAPIAAPNAPKKSSITLSEREARLGQKGSTILIFGPPGSGKASIAFALEKKLFDAGRTVAVMYGPDVRRGLSRDLGFSADDRSENLRRSAEAAKMMNDIGVICIAAFIAPFDAVRENAREVIGDERFVSVYLCAPMEICRERDLDRSYAAPRPDLRSQSMGLHEGCEPPSRPGLVIDTHALTIEQSVDRIIEHLRERNRIE